MWEIIIERIRNSLYQLSLSQHGHKNPQIPYVSLFEPSYESDSKLLTFPLYLSSRRGRLLARSLCKVYSNTYSVNILSINTWST